MSMSTPIILEKNVHGNSYRVFKRSEERLYMLVLFLDEECWHSVDFFRQWLLDPDPFNEFTGGNYYTLRKVEGMIVVDNDYYEGDIRPEFVEEGLPTNPHVFITTPEQMHSILLQWQKILDMNPRPNYVIIAQEGENVTIMPKDIVEI
jgi:hypothetical protein